MKSTPALSVLVLLVTQLGCGVKSKPLAPLKEPWISTGDLEKDKDKRLKTKKPISNENRVEPGSPALPPPAFDEKKEL